MQEHRELADSVCDFYTPCSTGRRMLVVQKGPVANDFNQSGALASIYKMIPNVCHIHHATSHHDGEGGGGGSEEPPHPTHPKPCKIF